MKYALIYLFGAVTASGWWAAALWGHYTTEMGDRTQLFIPPVLATATAATLFAAVMVAISETEE